MLHVTPEMRRIMVMAKKAGKKTKEIAEFLGVSRKTVWKWNKRAHHPGKESFRDKSRRPHHINKKITPLVENAIIILRDSFNWGTQRIKLSLQSPPPYIKYLFEHVLGEWKNVEVSRQTINNVLKKHKRNGFPYKGGKKNWNYFRAKSPNDLWQMDVKGPFRIEGKKQYALIIIDDNSRYILHCNIYDRIKTEDVIHSLKETIEKYGRSKKILVDNDKKFARKFVRVLSIYRSAEDLINIGAYVDGSDPEIDMAKKMIRGMNKFLRQDINEKVTFEESILSLKSLFSEV